MNRFVNNILSLFLIGALFFSTSGYYNVEHNCACGMVESCTESGSDCCSIYKRMLAEESACDNEHKNHNNCNGSCVVTCSYDVNRKIINPEQLPVSQYAKLKPEMPKATIVNFEEENNTYFSFYYNLNTSIVSPKTYGKSLVISLNQLKTPCLINS